MQHIRSKAALVAASLVPVAAFAQGATTFPTEAALNHLAGAVAAVLAIGAAMIGLRVLKRAINKVS